ncbi:MAG: hypothetical protein ABFS43_14650 [Thermodesulfobacteriota bacterium]
MAVENDIVLIYIEEQPLSFARVESILPDSKPDWYHITLLLLQVPLQITTWILKDVYINGDTFTMNGKKMRLEKVVAPEIPMEEEETHPIEEKPTEEKPTKDNVISFKGFKKE